MTDLHRDKNKPGAYVEPLEGRRLLTLTGPLFIGERPTLPAKPTILFKGDFNGDGKVDLLVGARSTSVMLNVGNGDFQSQTVATQFIPEAVGDFNRDGKLDIVAVKYGTSAYLLTGNGDGTFATGATLALNRYATVAVAADLNGDGKLDVASVNADAQFALTIQLGNGDGTFQPASTSTLSGSTWATILAVDLNHDGKVDLVLSRGNSVAVMLGNGDGTFGAMTITAVATGVESIVTDDFNNDGYPDLAVSESNGYSTILLLNNGSGVFSSTPVFVGSGSQLVSADFNQDGNVDLAIDMYSSTAGSLPPKILLGNGHGAFSDGGDIVGVDFSSAFAAADFDGDGVIDLAAGNSLTWTVSISKGLGDGHFTGVEPPTQSLSSNATSVLSADFNGDGKRDLAVSLLNGPVSIFTGDGLGHFTPTTSVAMNTVPDLQAVDLNGDSKLDLVATGTTSGALVALNLGDGTFAAPVSYAVSSAFDIRAADVNNDGKLDLIAAIDTGFGSNHGSNLGILLGNGDGTFAAATYALGGTDGVIAVADFNGDGNVDVAAFTQSASTVNISLGNGAGAFPTYSSLTAVGFNNVDNLLAADFNNDGKSDLAAFTSAGILRVYIGHGDGTFAAPINVVVPQNDGYTPYIPASLTAVDLNGDGKLDVVIGGNASMYTALGLGDGHFGPVSGIPVPLDSNVAAPGDFNGDGKLDLVTSNREDKSYTVLLNQGIVAAPPALANAAFNIDTGSVAFSFDRKIDPSSVAVADLQISNLTTSASALAASVQISSDGKTLTFALPAALTDGNYRFRIPAGAVASVDGIATTADAELAGPSIFILAGDINHDRAVNFSDLVILAQNYGQSGKTLSQGNLDYSADGKVDFNDLVILAQHYGATLAVPAAIVTPVRSKDRPLLAELR